MSAPHVPTRLRTLGYRLLPGDGFSYILHLRPAEWPIMVAHTSLGLVLAVGLSATALAESLPSFAATLVVWVVCLNGGTLAINSAYDRDEGDIGYLNNPPLPPRYLGHFAILLMLVGQFGAMLLSARLAILYFLCVIMALMYSVPPIRLKAVAGADLLINVLGFGSMTFLAGWFATPIPLNTVGVLVAVAFALLFAAFYPLTQIYQVEEDMRRGDRTLVTVFGVRRSLVGSIVMTLAAFVVFGAAALEGGRGVLQLLLLLPALLVWVVLLSNWLRSLGSLTREREKRGMYEALGAWALTDVAVLAALIPS